MTKDYLLPIIVLIQRSQWPQHPVHLEILVNLAWRSEHYPYSLYSDASGPVGW